MRFKKLRLFVGAALLIFIVLVGNILALGAMQNNTAQGKDAASVPLAEAKKNVTEVVPIQTNSSASQSTQQDTTKSSTQVSQQSPPPTKTTTVKQPRRTRAS